MCFFKRITNIPCPSCGSTRSVISLIKGDLTDAVYINPLGLVIAFLMIVIPIWIIYDSVFHKDSFYRYYKGMELFFKKKWIAIPAILLVIMNWIWNIHKGL